MTQAPDAIVPDAQPAAAQTPPPPPATVRIATARADSSPMTIQGRVEHVPCTLLLDTGAEKSFVSEGYLRATGITRTLLVDPMRVEYADGTSSTATHGAHLRVQLRGLTLHAHVVVLPTLLSSAQIILGLDWLSAHSCQIDVPRRRYTVTHKGRSYVLRQGQEAKPIAAAPVAEMPAPISAAAVRRALRHGARAMLCLVRPPEPIPPSAPEPAHEAAGVLPAPPSEVHLLPPEIEALLREFSDVFEPVRGLPPDRGVEHVVDLEPGARPVYCHPYRMSPAEMAECERQVKALLEMGLIEPSNSPWGAPVLFVAKPDGSLRMVYDF